MTFVFKHPKYYKKLTTTVPPKSGPQSESESESIHSHSVSTNSNLVYATPNIYGKK